MHQKENIEMQNQQLLIDAYRIFFDANDYEPAILIGYCRLMKEILGQEMESTVCDIVLHQLIKVCKNFKDNAQFVLIARYGLNGKKPMTLEDIGEILYLTKSGVLNICNKSIEKLKGETLAKQYNIKVRKNCMALHNFSPTYNHISVLKLSTRTYNALSRAGITTVQQFMALSLKELQEMKGVGQNTLNEIFEKQKELNSQRSQNN